jgi:hypothetical protein
MQAQPGIAEDALNGGQLAKGRAQRLLKKQASCCLRW